VRQITVVPGQQSGSSFRMHVHGNNASGCWLRHSRSITHVCRWLGSRRCCDGLLRRPTAGERGLGLRGPPVIAAAAPRQKRYVSQRQKRLAISRMAAGKLDVGACHSPLLTCSTKNQAMARCPVALSTWCPLSGTAAAAAHNFQSTLLPVPAHAAGDAIRACFYVVSGSQIEAG